MKKTAFDKIVVGFVVLVVIIFALLMVYSISTAPVSYTHMTLPTIA